MANLLPLIKLRKHSVDEKQKVLAQLYREAEEKDEQKALLLKRLEDERKALDEHSPLEMFAYFGRFSQSVQRLIERINAERARIEVRIRVAQEDVRNAFADMKRIEIVNEERTKAEKKKQVDKESSEMDDIGIDSFRRNNEEEY